MRAAIYARVSTDRQGRDQTIDSQLAALRRWAEDRGHDLLPEHVFADSDRITGVHQSTRHTPSTRTARAHVGCVCNGDSCASSITAPVFFAPP